MAEDSPIPNPLSIPDDTRLLLQGMIVPFHALANIANFTNIWSARSAVHVVEAEDVSI